MIACATCGRPIARPSVMVCRACGRPCVPDDPRVLDAQRAGGVPMAHDFALVDVHSACCHADVTVAQRVTCSDACHEAYVARIEREFGATKRVTDETTGKTHLVPTRVIIERGIRREDLADYPEEAS